MDAENPDTPEPETPGTRLRDYIKDRWDRKRGGIRGLAVKLQTTPETMYEWFRDEREPNLHHIRGLANALGGQPLGDRGRDRRRRPRGTPG